MYLSVRGARNCGEHDVSIDEGSARGDWLVAAAAAVSLTAAAAGAFSPGNSSVGEGGNSTFADPDEQVNIFGFGQGTQPSGLNGSVQLSSSDRAR